ncbi:MAG: Nif3-like dinuclear metal center hexameric protein [Gammaproteobacteria bacterium]|jgi:dinuclear metal center YbgI/SA1388 family protein|nr:Nif3-like dinuclear metal center hexameric protein [Gammaproteobacteria bacterium]
MTILRSGLDEHLAKLLQVSLFNDYCCNGLQVEGAVNISKIVLGVTASQALVDKAIALQAQAIIVHHGYFWRNEAAAIVGMKQRRIKSLLLNDINLWAFHLPLDCHPQLGNNSQLGQLMGWPVAGYLTGEGPTGLGLWGELSIEQSAEQVALSLEQCLGRKILHIAPDQRPIRRIGWCTGGAQGYIDKAIELGLDAYVSGEISEATVHSARENGIHYFAAGHHATERGGVQALAQHLRAEMGLDCEFIDVDNPA